MSSQPLIYLLISSLLLSVSLLLLFLPVAPTCAAIWTPVLHSRSVRLSVIILVIEFDWACYFSWWSTWPASTYSVSYSGSGSELRFMYLDSDYCLMDCGFVLSSTNKVINYFTMVKLGYHECMLAYQSFCCLWPHHFIVLAHRVPI